MDFAYKATLTATVVAMVMLAARAFGDRLAGLLAGLPFTTVPALVWTGIEEGPALAAQVAVGSVVGCGAIAVFSLVYERAARRFKPALTLIVGLAAMLASALIAHRLDASVSVAGGVAIAACIAALTLMGREPTRSPTPPPSPGLTVILTALSAGAISAVISATALGLGPGLAGLLAALPIVGAATVTAEHAARGRASVTPFLRGYVVSSLGKAAFGAVFAVCVVPSGIVNALFISLLLGAVICLVGNRWLETAPRSWIVDA